MKNEQTLPTDWDQTVAKLNGSFLQSSHWAKFQTQLGRPIVFDRSDNWAYLATIMKVKGFCYIYSPYGPVAKNLEDFKEALGSLKKEAIDQKCDFIRLEPFTKEGSFDSASFKLQRVKYVQPDMTNRLDLSRSLENLTDNFKSNRLQSVRIAEKKDVTIKQSQDLAPFIKLMTQTTRQHKFSSHQEHYFQIMFETMAPDHFLKLYYADYQGAPIASTIVIDFNKTRYYVHGASDYTLNKLTGASSLLLWQCIVDAKSSDILTFDFWGVSPPEDLNHPWTGLSNFKRSYGGTDVKYPGTFDLPINRFRYFIYKIARSLFRK